MNDQNPVDPTTNMQQPTEPAAPAPMPPTEQPGAQATPAPVISEPPVQPGSTEPMTQPEQGTETQPAMPGAEETNTPALSDQEAIAQARENVEQAMGQPGEAPETPDQEGEQQNQ